jgi:transcriptional regulator with XRE-family HTH domain
MPVIGNFMWRKCLKMALSPEQCRAARALLNWTREQLAEASGVAMRALGDFETGAKTPRPSTLNKLTKALSEAGVALVQIDGTAGGVALLRRE